MRRFAPAAILFALAACGSPHPQGRSPRCAAPAQAGTHFTGTTWGTPEQRETVRTMIRRLMDETRVVPDTAAKKGGPRGSPGSFAALSGAQVEEFISAIIFASEKFMPAHLQDHEQWALVCAEISIESAFKPGTSGDNPGNTALKSVGPLQLTVGIWDDIFRKYANVPGLIHYDGTPWDPKQTDSAALATSIWDNVVASLWSITEQGRRGCPEWLGGEDGPCPKNMHTAFLGWVIGCPAVKAPGGDLAGQRDMYIASISTDLQMLGYSPDLIQAGF